MSDDQTSSSMSSICGYILTYDLVYGVIPGFAARVLTLPAMHPTSAKRFSDKGTANELLDDLWESQASPGHFGLGNSG